MNSHPAGSSSIDSERGAFAFCRLNIPTLSLQNLNIPKIVYMPYTAKLQHLTKAGQATSFPPELQFFEDIVVH
jgi:hypothetical protein